MAGRVSDLAGGGGRRTGLDVGRLPVGVGGGVGVTVARDLGGDELLAAAVRDRGAAAVARREVLADVLEVELAARFHARKREGDGCCSDEASACGGDSAVTMTGREEVAWVCGERWCEISVCPPQVGAAMQWTEVKLPWVHGRSTRLVAAA